LRIDTDKRAVQCVLPEDGILGPKYIASFLKYECVYFNDIKTFELVLANRMQ
jgi:hypothetical protein